jgi:hypothetical protein
VRLCGAYIFVFASLSGCSDDSVERQILDMEAVSKVGVACHQDVNQIRFEHSANCEKLAAAIAAQKTKAPTGASQVQAARFNAAVFNAERMLWQAYATSLDRTTYKPTGTVFDSITNRVRDPNWLRGQREQCLNERPAAECASAPETPLPL